MSSKTHPSTPSTSAPRGGKLPPLSAAYPSEKGTNGTKAICNSCSIAGEVAMREIPKRLGFAVESCRKQNRPQRREPSASLAVTTGRTPFPLTTSPYPLQSFVPWSRTMVNGHERPGDLPAATGSAFIAETADLAAFQSAKKDQVSAKKDDPSNAVLQSEDAISTVATATPSSTSMEVFVPRRRFQRGRLFVGEVERRSGSAVFGRTRCNPTGRSQGFGAA